jgi:hypothetical protein
MNPCRHLGIAVTAAVLLCAACQRKGSDASAAKPPDQCAARLATFDTLDFDVFSNQKWDRLPESHAANITVSWPDGHDTQGIQRHIEDLKGMFVYAPDTRIPEHPIRICSGDYTAVTGVMVGTFSKPMPLGNGKSAPATGKAFRLTMVTIGHWTGNTMDHEWLFWDNHAYMQQIGLVK